MVMRGSNEMKKTKIITRKDVHEGVNTYFNDEVMLNEETYFKVLELIIKLLLKGAKQEK